MDKTREGLIFPGASEMARRMREFDWARSPLGTADTWPQALKTVVRILLTSRQPMWIGWGSELTYLYNDPYKSIIGGKHPQALGQSTAVVWGEIWDDISPLLDTALGGNEGTYVEEQLLIMRRNGFPEETYYTFSYSPIANDDGSIGGILCANTDDTERVIGERRLTLLRELAARMADARNWRDTSRRAIDALGTNPRDLPFAMLYMAERNGRGVTRIGQCGIAGGHVAAPDSVALDEASAWPFAEVLSARDVMPVIELGRVFGDDTPRGAWHFAPTHAVMLPIGPASETGHRGALIVGLNPLRPFDAKYRSFLGLVASQIAASIANAETYEQEKQRAEALAEVDRAKTHFFTNISHEFRTPLTLMLGPLEDMLAKPAGGVLAENRELIAVVHRHSLRLLKLVNTLLDFSRIEAGRMRAVYAPVDLAFVTRDLVSQFQATVEKAGLRLIVDCPAMDEPVYVDRDMWEKIVLNLTSNAFKFTFNGEIEVSLRRTGAAAELRVRDTGVGIPADDLPHIFERFHRVEGARRRSHEGTGIGLALVRELASLHGGAVRVDSEEGRGTTFTVTVPLGSSHLPAERVAAAGAASATALPAGVFADEATGWLPDADFRGDDFGKGRYAWRHAGQESASIRELDATICPANDASDSGAARARIVLADDNADMREYVSRLLAQRFEVEAVADGAAALAAVRRRRPNLVLSDVMMPEMDGFELLARLRQDAALSDLPVIMLSARAGEKARVEGVQAGADDYLVKPFSSRELLARVSTHIELARVRHESALAVRRGEERMRMALDAARMVAWRWIPENDQVQVSDNAAELLGLGKIGSIEQAFAAIHPDDVQGMRATLANALDARGGFAAEFRLIRPSDGAVIWLEARGQVVEDGLGGQTHVAGVTTDITERKRIGLALAADKQLLQHIVDGASLHDVLDSLVRETEAQSTDGMLCSVLVADESGKRLLHGAAPSLPNEYNRAVDGLAIGPGAGSCGTAAFERRPVFVSDIAHDPLWTDFRQVAADHGLAACCSAPIFDPGGLLLGTMAMYYRQPREPSARDRQLIEHATRLAGIVLARERAERKLHESERRFRELLEALPAAVYTIDAEGRLTFVNQAAVDLAGRVPRLGVDAWCVASKIYEPDGAPLPHDQCPMAVALKEGRPVRGREIIVERPDGRRLTVVPYPTPLRDASGTIVGAVNMLVDVTERKRGEELILQSEERLRAALANSSTGTFLCNPSTGEYLEFDDNLKRLFGLDAQHHVRWLNDIIDRIHPDDAPLVTAAIDRRRDNSDFELEFRVLLPDGRIRWLYDRARLRFHADGRPAHFVGACTDITRQKLAEQASARLAAIVEWSDDAIVSKDLNGIITSWNRGAERTFGYRADEVIGQSITMLIPQDQLDHEPRILERIGRGEAIDHYETVRRRKDGQLIDVSLTISPIFDAQGRIVGASKIARDVTERKQLEHSLREADRRKDEFLATLAHELRNPLAPLRQGLELLRAPTGLGADTEDVHADRPALKSRARRLRHWFDVGQIAH